MTDIVERLRQGIDALLTEGMVEAELVMDKAADEIERLRKELSLLKGRWEITPQSLKVWDADGKLIVNKTVPPSESQTVPPIDNAG